MNSCYNSKKLRSLICKSHKTTAPPQKNLQCATDENDISEAVGDGIVDVGPGGKSGESPWTCQQGSEEHNGD